MKKIITVLILLLFGSFIMTEKVSAHSGGLDDSGCHYCRTDCEAKGLTDNLYHCHSGDDRDTYTIPVPEDAEPESVPLPAVPTETTDPIPEVTTPPVTVSVPENIVENVNTAVSEPTSEPRVPDDEIVPPAARDTGLNTAEEVSTNEVNVNTASNTNTTITTVEEAAITVSEEKDDDEGGGGAFGALAAVVVVGGGGYYAFKKMKKK